MPTKYDENVLQTYADWLYSQARWIIFMTALRYAVVGAIIGALFVLGFRIFDPPSISEAGQSLHVSSGVCAFIAMIAGIERGKAKAMELKIEAQRLLCDVQIERNTRHP